MPQVQPSQRWKPRPRCAIETSLFKRLTGNITNYLRLIVHWQNHQGTWAQCTKLFFSPQLCIASLQALKTLFFQPGYLRQENTNQRLRKKNKTKNTHTLSLTLLHRWKTAVLHFSCIPNHANVHRGEGHLSPFME